MPSNLLIDPPKDPTGPSPDLSCGDVDVEAWSATSASAVRGEVRFDDGSRALYADRRLELPAGPDRRRRPPRRVDDVIGPSPSAGSTAPRRRRGGGTSLTGGCCNVAVVMDLSKYCNQILWIDPEPQLARVQPGIVLDHLRREAEKHA